MRKAIATMTLIAIVSTIASAESLDQARETCDRFADRISVLWTWTSDSADYIVYGRAMVDEVESIEETFLAEIAYLYTWAAAVVDQSIAAEHERKKAFIDYMRSHCLSEEMR